MTHPLTIPFLIASIIWPAISIAEEAKTQLGVAHIGGRYAFSNTDYLNEGASVALKFGARCIKVGLSLDTENPSPNLYPFHSDWPVAGSLDALADTPHFRVLFAKDFDTFILNAFRKGRSPAYWRDGISEEEIQAEQNCFTSLTRYLLSRYGKEEKTFILQNWEGDWALRGSFDPSSIPTLKATAAMIKWLAARQRGVEHARREFPGSRARVFHACEVNLVRQSMEKGAPGVATDVLPHLQLDLVSYSAWDTKDDPAQFEKALTFIARHKPETSAFGKRGVYVGEFGLPESESTPREVLKRTTVLLEKAKKFGCPYAVYWQLYCNEPLKPDPKTNADYKGFWLIRPDSSRSPVCSLFSRTDN